MIAAHLDGVAASQGDGLEGGGRLHRHIYNLSMAQACISGGEFLSVIENILFVV